jgi:hypothetical protein
MLLSALFLGGTIAISFIVLATTVVSKDGLQNVVGLTGAGILFALISLIALLDSKKS